MNTGLPQTPADNWNGGNTSKLKLEGHNYSNAKARQDTIWKASYKPISLLDLDAKIIKKILTKQI